MPAERPGIRRPRRGAGYSLAEVVVSLAIFAAILLGVLFVFNLNYRLARGRSDAAARQEALRRAQNDLVRMVRLAGRGGLPHDLAIEVASNVVPGSRIGGPDSPRVVAGSDILTVRGVFSTPLFRVGPADGGLRLGEAGAPPAGVVEIRDPSPQTGVAQSLAELAAGLEARRTDSGSLLLVSQLDESIFAVVASDPGRTRITRVGELVTAVALSFDAAGAPPGLAGSGPAEALRGAAVVGLLEEYRFYLRAAFSTPGDERSVPRPQLSMARFVPGTDRPWDQDPANLAIDLADDIIDFQVALGGDLDGDGQVAAEAAAPGADEWLYNEPEDDPDDPRWKRRAWTPGLVRITAVARAERPDPDYRAPPPARLEDHLPEPSDEPPGDDRRRRWRLESVVDLGDG